MIKAYKQHQPDALGLSGLLVKSAQMMVATAQDLKTAGIRCPILVGGAALSSRFTRMKIAPEYEGLVAYANDAMAGLDLANQLMDGQRREALAITLEAETQRLLGAATPVADNKPKIRRRGPAVVFEGPIPEPPDLKLHLLRDYDLEEIFRYINPVMLYTRHLGFKNFEHAIAAGDPKALELRATVDSVGDEMLARSDITARAAYRFFPVHSDGDRRMMVYGLDGKSVIESFTFGRQSERARTMPGRLRHARIFRPYRLLLHVRRNGDGRRARAGRGMEEQGRVSALAYPARAGARGCGGVFRTAPSSGSAGCGELAIPPGSR